MEKREKIYKIIMLVILTAFITFMITSISLYTYFTGEGVGTLLSGTISDSSTSDLDTRIARIRRMIDNNFLKQDEIDEEELIDGAIQGYVAGLGDVYTEYIPADEMEEYTETIVGSFVGIGIYMIGDEETDSIIIYYPIPESPAERAGLKSGDKIISVDGVNYTYEDFDTIADQIKGEAGTKVTLVIERDGEQLTFEITREQINTNPITTEMLDNGIGYLNLPSFDSDTAEHFKEKVEELENQGMTSLIIDLRNNGGGIVDEATEIADFILEKGAVIMTTVDKDGNSEETISENAPIIDMPIVILTNENTASASEILVAALKEHNKATIIGTTTYGKGVIQTLYTLSDGSGLKITTAEYYTPNNNAINEVGIEPSIEVELPDTITNIYSVEREDDTQLQRAIEELTKE